jgi:DNA-binding CsgD family transcriptional regulator
MNIQSSASTDNIRTLVDHFGKLTRLSPRQLEVVNLAVTGVHRKQCAAQLACSLKTVEGYWQRIYEKTGCRSEAEVIATFIREAVRACQHQASDETDAGRIFPS